MDWKVIELAVPLLAKGTLVTIRVSLIAGALASVLGGALGLIALSGWAPLRVAVRAYVDFIRGTPILIQIFIVFFGLPWVGIRMDEVWAGTVALALNGAGYIAETVRGVVGSVERGQSEAAKSIGMVNWQILTFILLPQSFRPMIPPLTNELITLLKSSSLLSVISVYELTRAGQAIVAMYFVPFEIYGLIGLYYYLIVKGLSIASRRLERTLHAW
jgi:polar amino acid transport system permease protein